MFILVDFYYVYLYTFHRNCFDTNENGFLLFLFFGNDIRNVHLCYIEIVSFKSVYRLRSTSKNDMEHSNFIYNFKIFTSSFGRKYSFILCSIVHFKIVTALFCCKFFDSFYDEITKM